MAAIAQHAATGDWRTALRLSITTGIVVAQTTAWDRAIGRALAHVFHDNGSEVSLATASAQAILTTAMGVSTIFLIHKWFA